MVCRQTILLFSARVAAIMAKRTSLDLNVMPKLLYKSENFLVVSKCHDIKINSDDRSEITTEQQLRHLFPELVDEKVKHGFRYVHRLDYATSGVLCLGLSRGAASSLWKQFVARNVTKYYLALIWGHVNENTLFIDVATGDLEDTDWPGRRCTPDHPQCRNPKDTKTLLISLEKGTYMDKPATKVLLKPLTGRTHQLRVHCDHIGHTIVGDYTYSLRADTDPDRMMLHSHRLISDTGSETLDVTSADPFTAELISQWNPQDICNTYDSAINTAGSFNLDDHSVKTISYCLETT